MEVHYNGAVYKRRLEPIRLLSRVLCGYEDYGPGLPGEVQCTAKMRAQRESDDVWVTISVQWTLTKLGASRGKLRWTLRGPRVFDSQMEIVSPRKFGLRRF